MKTTTSGRAFAKGIFDVFSTLMVSLRIENHKIRFRSYPNSFNAEAAIANLNNLQVVQSNRGTDPYDPTRIITHVTTTQFSLSRDMARNLCQTFMDARLIESAIDPTKREFQSRGLYQITPKGAHLVAKFVVRNSLPIEESRHITTNSASNMLHVERTDDEDAIILTLKHVDMIFKRFAGPEPNIVKSDVSTAGSGGTDSVTASGGSSTTSSTSGRDRSAADSSSGIEIRDQQLNYETYKQTFYGKAAVDWLLDNITVISKEEAICICQEMVSAGYIEQVGEENRDGPSLFKTGNSALYHLTETGRAVAGWKSLDDGNGNSIHTDWMDERSAIGAKGDRSHAESNPLSVQFKLISTSNTSRLPISIVVRENRKSMDEASLSGFQYSSSITGGTGDASTRSGAVAGGMAHASGTNTRRLSQILNDPAFQITLSENGSVVGGSVVAGGAGANGGPMSSYAPSSSGRESVGASAGGSRLSPPLNSTTQSTTSNTSRLNGILSDSVVRDLFKSFLKQNICEENLTFFLEVLDYKSKFSTLISTARSYHQSATGQEQNSWRDADGQNGWNLYPPSLRELEKQICTQAFAIFETYLIQGAPKEVNLPHQMRHDITSYMQAVVRNMGASDVGSGASQSSENKNLPPTPTSPSSTSTASSAATLSSLTESRSDADKYTVAGAAAVGGATTSNGGQKELIHISLFDTIHDHIFRLMSTDSVPKFIKTDKYLEVVMSKHKRKAAANAAAATRAGAGALAAGQEMSRGSMVSDINDSNTHRDNNDGLSTISLSSGNEDGTGLQRSLTSTSRSHPHYRSEHGDMTQEPIIVSNGNSNGNSNSNSNDNSNSNSTSIGGKYANGSIPMDSRSQSAGNGLIPVRHSSVAQQPPSFNSATTSSSANLQHLRMPRVRSASSNVSVNGMSSQNYQHRQQQQQHPNNGDASVASVGTPKLRANTNNGQVPRLDPSSLSTTGSISFSSSGTPIAARQPALSLMDIYAHQQHLQQYSNQRAQLTHAQITQMYMMRHSAKSNPSLSSAASTPSSVATSSDVAGGSSSGASNSAANNIMRTASVRVRKDGDDDDDLPLIHQQQQKQQRERQRSNEKRITSPVSATSQQVTVLFEATSHSMQDQENKVVKTVNDSGKDMASLTIPSLASETASSIILSVAGAQSADVPGRYPVNSVGGSGAGNAMYSVDAITLEDMRQKS